MSDRAALNGTRPKLTRRPREPAEAAFSCLKGLIMLALTNPAAVAHALNCPDLDPDLRPLIASRVGQLCAEEGHLDPDTRVIVVEGGDTPEVINDAVGFDVTGEDPEEPSYETIEDHGLWFEITYPRRDGLRTFIFVENTPATELGIHHLCLSHFWPDDEGAGR